MSALKRNFHIKERDFIRAGNASIQIQNLLKSLGIDAQLIRKVAVCCYEGEMNVVMHGENGTLTLQIGKDKITLDILDAGHGIEDIELAMKEGFSTASEEDRKMGFGAGMGLPNMKKNADRFAIHSENGDGTHVHLEFLMKQKDAAIER